MKALVLSGGGSKGSYQIGVWKALRKMHIKFDIITGTSVGALNGALITQNNYWKAISVWKKINLKVLFGENITESNTTLGLYKMYGNQFIKNGGMEVKKLEELIDNSLNRNRFYKSKINYGLVTYNLSKKAPVQLQKKEIPSENLVDYLMASASCYPAFKQKDIDGKKYIDGGIVDNLPINLAISMGATEIIAVDLNAPGIKQIPKKKLPTIMIKPNNKLSNFLKFDEQGTKRNMKLGYNDTMKALKKLDGQKFTFKKNHIAKNKKELIETYEYMFNKILNSEKLVNKFKELIKTSSKSEQLADKFILKIMEQLGYSLNLEETKIYTTNKFNRKLKKELKLRIKNQTNKKRMIKAKRTEIELFQEIKKENYKELRKLAFLNPIEFLKAIYLYIICEG